jgi:hypothetical protein
MTSSVTPVETVTELVGDDPLFDRARELKHALEERIGDAAETLCEFAEEIEGLRERYSLGQGGDRKSKSHMCDFDRAEGGFHAQLEAQVGLHREQARRILERADYVRRLLTARAGKPVEYITGTGKAKHKETFLPSAEAQKCAEVSLVNVMAGEVSASGAWAGLVGEDKRKAKTGKKERAEINHYKNCERAAGKFATSLEHYYTFTVEQRDYLDAVWAELLAKKVIPEAWLVMTANAEKKRRP